MIITMKELHNHFEDDDFCEKYGNPVYVLVHRGSREGIVKFEVLDAVQLAAIETERKD